MGLNDTSDWEHWEKETEGGFLHPGEEILVPHLDRYLLCANEEEGVESGFYMDAFGEMCPTRYYMAKPLGWYYGDMHVLERTRYLAARVADGPELFGRKYSSTEFYGREGWAFGRLHNPFAVALEYSPDADCEPLRMAKGPQ